jgi:hypothetical protein
LVNVVASFGWVVIVISLSSKIENKCCSLCDWRLEIDQLQSLIA